MKKLLVVVLLLALFLQPTVAQPEHKVFLPLVSNNWSSTMSDWKIVVPEATTNYCLNPSAEIAGNFNAVGGGTHTRVTTVQFADVYSYRIQTAANDQGGRIGLLALSNNIHYVTMRVAGMLPATWDWSLNDAAYTAPALLETIDATWSLYGLQFPAAQANGATFLYVRQNGAGAGDFNLDAVQVEQKTYWTTYVDGTRPGCEWNGAAHGSTSQRSAVSRAGGLVQDLQDDYSFEIGGMIATGMPAIMNAVDGYAILPGGELNSIKVESRVFTLTGVIRGTSLANLHANRQALLDVLKPNAMPDDAEGPQPVRLRYVGAAVQKQIAAHYEGGLETRIEARMECWERLAIRFLADDPYWYEIGDSAAVLVSNDTATLRHLTARLRSTGQWDDLNIGANPDTGNVVYAIAIAPDKSIYIGGSFTGWNGIGGRDWVARYDPQTDAWSTVGGASDFNAQVFDLEFGPDGTLYAAGDFVNVAGDGNANYVAKWDGANWTAVAGGGTAPARTLIFGLDGLLYIGGEFVNWNGLGANYIVSWDGANYAAVGTSVTSWVYCLDVAPSGNIIAGGNFQAAGAVTVNHIAEWDGTVWTALGNGFDDIVYDVAVADDGTIYAGGIFTTDFAAINPFAYIAVWNGTSWSQLGTGLNDFCYALEIAPNGILFVGGAFTVAGPITLTDRLARWNGTSWAHVDIDFPGGPIIPWSAMTAGNADPVIANNFDLWIGFTSTGAGVFAGSTIVANDGTERAFPKFVVSRTIGTSAVLEEIRNETAGKELLFDYSLLDGEELVITLTPTQKSIVSSMFGSRLDAILANSDFGTFVLQPGNNQITIFVATDATVFAYALWKDKFWSSD